MKTIITLAVGFWLGRQIYIKYDIYNNIRNFNLKWKIWFINHFYNKYRLTFNGVNINFI